MSNFLKDPAIILALICIVIGFVLVILIDRLNKKLKHKIDRQKLMDLKDLSDLYKTPGQPPVEILDESGLEIFKKRRKLAIAAIVFYFVVPGVILIIKCNSGFNCIPHNSKCKEAQK